jgi:hypothetical protein
MTDSSSSEPKVDTRPLWRTLLKTIKELRKGFKAEGGDMEVSIKIRAGSKGRLQKVSTR